MNLLLFLGVLAVGVIPNPDLDHWETQETFLFLFLILVISWRLQRKFHPLVGISYLIGASSACVHYLFPKFYFWEFGKITEASFGSVVAGSALYLSLIACTFLVLSESNNAWIQIALIVLSVIDSLFVIFTHGHYWVQSNPAMDATFIVIMLPLILGAFKNKFQVLSVLGFLTTLSVVISQSSTGLMGLGVGFGAWLFLEYGGIAILGVALVGLVLILFGFHHLGFEFLNSNGRTGIWNLSMNYFFKEVDMISGAGTGSYYLYGPALFNSPFVWLHNDWLQVLFENGFLGLVSALSLFLTMLWKARKRPGLMSAILTYGVCAFTQMLLRFPITAILGATLIHATFVTERPLGRRGLASPEHPPTTVKNFLGRTIPLFLEEEPPTT